MIIFYIQKIFKLKNFKKFGKILKLPNYLLIKIMKNYNYNMMKINFMQCC